LLRRHRACRGTYAGVPKSPGRGQEDGEQATDQEAHVLRHAAGADESQHARLQEGLRAGAPGGARVLDVVHRQLHQQVVRLRGRHCGFGNNRLMVGVLCG